MFLLKTLWKVEQVLSCLQHRLIDLVKHGWRFLLIKFFTFKIFFVTKNLVTPDYVSKIFVSFECQNWRNSKISFNFGSICKICYFLSIIVLRSGRFLLYVTASGKYSILDVLILFSNSFLGIVIAQLICIVVSAFFFVFFIWVFLHDHLRITELQGKGEGISLTRHYHFHPLHRHLDIIRAITAGSSLLHTGSTAGLEPGIFDFWAQVANH